MEALTPNCIYLLRLEGISESLIVLPARTKRMLQLPNYLPTATRRKLQLPFPFPFLPRRNRIVVYWILLQWDFRSTIFLLNICCNLTAMWFIHVIYVSQLLVTLYMMCDNIYDLFSSLHRQIFIYPQTLI